MCEWDGPVCVKVGDRIQVYWESEAMWYGGKVLKVDDTDNTYLVHYFADCAELWHGSDMDVRALVEWIFLHNKVDID